MKPAFPILACASLAALIAGQATAETLRVLSAWDQNFVFNKTMLEPLLEKIETATGGDISFTVNGPEVVPTFEQFEPVQAGAFDMLFAHPGYFSGDAGLGVTIDAIDPDPVARRESGIWDYMDEYYQARGLKLISMPPQGENGLLFVTKDPLPESDKPFAGLKLRANVTYHALVETLGGAPVLMSGGEIYPGLQAGLIDGAAWSVVGVTDFKLNEVAGYWTEPSYGQTGTIVLMNLDSWKNLPDEARAAIETAGLETEKETMALYGQLNDRERELMAEAGMQPTRYTDAVAAKLNDLWAEGVWSLGDEKAGVDAAAFREFAASKGMTPAAAAE